MTCDEWRIFLQDYVDGALSPPAKEALDRHLSDCAACLTEARAHQAVEARLSGQVLVEPPAGLIDRIFRQLEPAGGWKREWLRLAAAAALLVVIGGTAYGTLVSNLPAMEIPSLREPLEHAERTLNDLIQKARY